MYRSDMEIAKEKFRVQKQLYRAEYYGDRPIKTLSKANKWLDESTKEWEDYRIINTNINGFNVFALVDSFGRVGAQGFNLEDCIVNTCKRLGLKVPKLK